MIQTEVVCPGHRGLEFGDGPRHVGRVRCCAAGSALLLDAGEDAGPDTPAAVVGGIDDCLR